MEWLQTKEFGSRTKNEHAFFVLREAILSGQLKPGAPLNVSEIAENLKMSEIPVREALRQLQVQRLVTIQSHRGAFVSNPSQKEIEDNLATREILEPIATRLAAPNINNTIIEALNRILGEMEKAVHSSDYLSYAVLNRKFHHTIYSACPNQELRRIIAELWVICDRCLDLFSVVPDRLLPSICEHREIVRALEIGDGEVAAEITRLQKRKSFREYLRSIGKHESDFSAIHNTFTK